LADRLDRLIECERVTVVLCNEHREIVRSVVIQGHTPREIRACDLQQAEISVIQRVLATSTPVNEMDGLCSPMIFEGSGARAISFAARHEPYSTEEAALADALSTYLATLFDPLARDNVIRLTATPQSAEDERDTTRAAAGALSAKISHLAQHDVLTNLPNRWLLSDRLDRAIASARRNGTRLAVLFIDLDRFKHVNDSLGHAIGDQLLRASADRLTACIRQSDTLSRYGG